MKQQKQSIPLSYYGVTALWLLFIMLQPLINIPLAVTLSVGIFTLLRLIQPDPISASCESPAKNHPEPSPNHVLQLGDAAILSLRQVMEQIQNPEVREIIIQLEVLGGRILNEVQERPEKLPQIETFVNYYLPTTLNILNAYRRAEATGIAGENISSTKRQIENMLGSSILIVFNKQLDSLFGSDALDISLELSVLKSMMVREGIAGEKIEAETIQNSDGSYINLTL